ncbi:MAG: type II secretion system protein [Vampirovibrionales bacterium]
MFGFTLSELLISLAVLGLISALTLPSIFNNFQLSQRKALFKETLQMISTATQADFMENGTQNGWHTMLKNRTAWEISCESSADTRCNLTGSLAGRAGNEKGLKFPTGVVMKFENGGANRIGFVDIDINGSLPPNTDGQDQLVLCSNISNTVIGTPGVYSLTDWTQGLRPGEVRPCENHNGVSRRYDWIWQ